MTHPQIPLLNGRRAVVGDVVECVTRDFEIPLGYTQGVETDGPVFGGRYTVHESASKPDVPERLLALKEMLIGKRGQIRYWYAKYFVITPPPTPKPRRA